MEASADFINHYFGCSCERRCSDCFGYSFDFLFSELDHYFSEMVPDEPCKKRSPQLRQAFLGGADLINSTKAPPSAALPIGPQEGIFYSGMTEFLRSRASNLEARAGTFGVIDGVSRAMRARYQRELDILESGLSVLATIGSVSPYIGLFGTVWGIMDAFTGLGNLESASLAVVAPGIAEALVATAIGLFAAIPAVIGYNRFAYSLDRLSSQYESFMQEFQNILGRQA